MVEEPKTFYQKKQPFSLRDRQMLISALIGVCLLGVFAFYANQSGPRSKTAAPDDVREAKPFYSRAEIENLIKEQMLAEQQKEKTPESQEKPVTPIRRKLDSKIAVFVKEAEKKQVAVANQKQSPELKIPTGVKIKAHLANAIFSFNVSSPVIAVADEDYEKDGKVIVPKGTQFIGQAGVLQSLDRVNIRFSAMVLPGGKEVKVRAMALSLDGSGGIKGKVDRQFDKSLLKAAGQTVLAGASLLVGTQSRAMTLEDELRLHAARNLTTDAQRSLNEIKVEKSITVEAYTPILILFLDSTEV